MSPSPAPTKIAKPLSLPLPPLRLISAGTSDSELDEAARPGENFILDYLVVTKFNRFSFQLCRKENAKFQEEEVQMGKCFVQIYPSEVIMVPLLILIQNGFHVDHASLG